MSAILGGLLDSAARAWAALAACGNPDPPIGEPPPDPPGQPVKFKCLTEWRCRYDCEKKIQGGVFIIGPVAVCTINPLDPSHPTNPGIGAARWAALPRGTWQWCNPSISGCGTGRSHYDCGSARPGWDMTFSMFVETEEEIPWEEYNATPLANPTCPWPPDPASAPAPITEAEVEALGGKCPLCYRAYPCRNNVPGGCGTPNRSLISSCCRLSRTPDIFPPRTPYIDTEACGGSAGNPWEPASTCEYRFCSFNDYSDPRFAFVRKCQGVPGTIRNSVNYGCGSYISGNTNFRTSPYGSSCGWWECLKLEPYMMVPGESLGIIEPFGGTDEFFQSVHPTCDDCAFDGPIITLQRCSSSYIDPNGACSTVGNAVVNNKIFFKRWGSYGGNTRTWMEANVDADNKIYFASTDGWCWVMEYLPNPSCTQMNMTMWSATVSSPTRAVFVGYPTYISRSGSGLILVGARLKMKDCCDCEATTGQRSGIPNSVCNPPVGACCIQDEGRCLDVHTNAQCNALEPARGPTSWFNARVCGDISCVAPKGACCKGGGNCSNNMTKDHCLNFAGGMSWYRGKNCAALTPAECEKKGACCDMSISNWRMRCSQKTKRVCLSRANRVWKGADTNCTNFTIPSDICKTPREKRCGVYGDNINCTVITIVTYQNSCSGARPVSSQWFTSGGAMWGFVNGGAPDRSFIGRWICAGSSITNTGFPGKITNIQYPVKYKDIPLGSCKNKLTVGLGGNNRRARDGAGNYKTYKYCAYKAAVFSGDDDYVKSCSAKPVTGREDEGGGGCGGNCGGRNSWRGCCHCPPSSGGT